MRTRDKASTARNQRATAAQRLIDLQKTAPEEKPEPKRRTARLRHLVPPAEVTVKVVRG